MIQLIIFSVIFILVSSLVIIGNKVSRKKGKLSNKQKNWWLIAHVLFVMIYFSGLVGQILMTISTKFIIDREQLSLAHLYILHFDDYVIVPGGIGTLITGVWLAVRTHWGFAKYKWVITKWVGNIAAILLGSTIIGGRIHGAFPIIFTENIHPLQNPAYFHSMKILILGIAISLAILIFLVVISYFKPWGKRATKTEV